MIGPVPTTPFDLRFRLFDVPVTVTPWFLLAALVGGWQPSSREHLDLLAIWIGCLFVSILVHEMGHALFAKAFGWPPQVYLYHFGGLAVYQPTFGHTTSRSVIISFAGPGAGFLLYGLVKLAERAVMPGGWFATLGAANQHRLIDFFRQMEWINLGWGLVNLIPALPLDGGRVAEALLMHRQRYQGRVQAVKLSVLAAGAAALFFFTKRDEWGTFPALLFGLICISNIHLLQQGDRSDYR